MQFFFWLNALLISVCLQISAIDDLAICAIFQDEAPFFKEWIEFHKLQGVQHFYLYNNNSNDDYLEKLNPYLLTEQVTLIEWPHTYEYGDHKAWIDIQTGAYLHCIQNYGNDAKWLAFIDIDEFLFCPNGEKLPDFLKHYERYPGLCVNWIKFGTSDIDDIPPEFCLIELLTRCSAQNIVDNKFVKSIVQPQYVERAATAHYFLYKDGRFAVDVTKKPCFSNCTKQNRVGKIRINHYWTRTIKYLYENKINSRQKRRPQYNIEVILTMVNKYNQNTDSSILRYVKDLRAAMGFPEIASAVNNRL